jgi:Na+/H+-dicarboxylate symporter
MWLFWLITGMFIGVFVGVFAVALMKKAHYPQISEEIEPITKGILQ